MALEDAMNGIRGKRYASKQSGRRGIESRGLGGRLDVNVRDTKRQIPNTNGEKKWKKELREIMETGNRRFAESLKMKWPSKGRM